MMLKIIVKKFCFWQSRFWLWENNHYREISDQDVEAEVTGFIADQIDPFEAKTGRVRDVLLNLRSRCKIPDTFEQPGWIDGCHKVTNGRLWMHFANGLVYLPELYGETSPTIYPHDPAFFSRICLPYPYDEHAQCQQWIYFLQEVLPDPECRKLLQEWFGYCLIPDTSLQRFLLLEGTGANGKSVALSVLMALLGPDNVSAVSLENFGGTYNLTETLGKLANITPEIGELDKTAEGILKAFVSGEILQFNQKYKPVFTARPTARLVLATNTRPRFSDKSQGLWRRLLLIPFPNTIPEEMQDPSLAEKLVQELPGILNWAVEGLKRLHLRGRFEEPLVCQQAKQEYIREVNPVRLFLRNSAPVIQMGK
jgi:P4 family phage/plasmid primase-like protien